MPAANGSNGVGTREAAGQPGEAAGAAAAAATAARKLGKDPSAKTDFLPDREREAAEAAVRAQLKKEYELRQKVGPRSLPLASLQSIRLSIGTCAGHQQCCRLIQSRMRSVPGQEQHSSAFTCK
jgi:hypothetical protein